MQINWMRIITAVIISFVILILVLQVMRYQSIKNFLESKFCYTRIVPPDGYALTDCKGIGIGLIWLGLIVFIALSGIVSFFLARDRKGLHVITAILLSLILVLLGLLYISLSYDRSNSIIKRELPTARFDLLKVE